MTGRRRSARLVFWISLGSLFVVVGVAAWVLAARGESYLRARLEEELSSRLGARATIGGLELSVLPPTASATEVAISPFGGGRPLASARKVEVTARWRDLREVPLRLRSLDVQGLVVRTERDESGRFRWLRLKPQGDGGRGISVDRVTVSDGEVVFEERNLPLDLTLTRFEAQAAGQSDRRFAGRLDAADVVVVLPNGAEYAGAVSARAAWSDGRFEVLAGRIGGPDLNVVVEGGGWDQVDRQWELSFQARGSAGLARHLGLSDLDISGDWTFDGALSGRESWALGGRLTARDLDVDGRRLRSLDAALSAGPDRLRLDGVRGRFYGGDLEAAVEVLWSDPNRPVRVEANVSEGDLPALMNGFGLGGLDLVGRWSAVGVYHCTASDPLAGRGTIDATLLAGDRAGRIGWSRRVPIEVERGVVTFRTLHRDLASERVAASGHHDLRSGRGDMEYRVDTGELGAWLDILGVGGDPQVEAWLPSAGTGSLEGRMTWRPGDFSTRVAVRLNDVTIGQLHAAVVQGALSAAPAGLSDVHLDFTRPDGALLLTGGLSTGSAAPGFDLLAETSGWPVEEFLRQLGLPEGLSGPLEGSVVVTGDAEALDVTSRLRIPSAALAGIPLGSVSADLRATAGSVHVSPLEVEAPAGNLRAEGVVALTGGEVSLDLELAVADMTASPFDLWLPPGSNGSLSGSGRLSGSLQDPRLVLDLAAGDLRLGSLDLSRAGPTRLSLGLENGDLLVDGSLGDLLSLRGGGLLTEEATELEVEVSGERLGSLVQAFSPGTMEGLDGGFDGVVRVAGNPSAGELHPHVELDRLELSYGGKALEAIEPVRATWGVQGLDIESLFLGDPAGDSEVFVFGRVHLADKATLDLKSQLSIDTTWFGPFLPDWELTGGRFEGLATIEGSLEEPSINGQGELRQQRVRIPGNDQPLDQVRAVVLFYPGQVVLDEGSASTAGGAVRAAGTVTPFADGGPSYRFQIVAEDLQLRYPEGWRTRGRGELTVTSEQDGRIVRGLVTIDRAEYSGNVEVGVLQLLQGAFARRVELVEEPSEALVATRLNVIVRGPGALRVRNNVADLRGDVDFVLRGNAARPVVFGEVRVEPGGTLLYSGNDYEVRRAALQFTNPYRVEPVIDLVATTRLREYDVTLDVEGTLERLEVNFASNPPLADLEVLALLTGGEAPLAALPAGGQAPAASAQSFLYGQAASVVADRVNRLFGLDKFRIHPLTGESGSLSSARVTVGKRLSRDLFATYSYDPSLSELQILELEWQVSSDLTVIATQNGDSSYAIDLRWEKSF